MFCYGIPFMIHHLCTFPGIIHWYNFYCKIIWFPHKISSSINPLVWALLYLCQYISGLNIRRCHYLNIIHGTCPLCKTYRLRITWDLRSYFVYFIVDELMWNALFKSINNVVLSLLCFTSFCWFSFNIYDFFSIINNIC